MIGRTVSHYRIVEKLGSGGMGVVYRAVDTTLGRDVALKFLPTELTREPVARQRFEAEARAAAAIEHPNICTVHEIDETDDGQMFISMAYCPGCSLRSRVKNGPVPVAEAVRIAIEAGRGLAAAHARGIVHRDVKSANIVLTGDGRVKIVDFGLAKLDGHEGLTRTGATIGTTAYLSPEQARGKPVDARTDIWALGIVLFELLTGRLPFEGLHEQAMVYAILNHEPTRAGDLRHEVPLLLERVIAKALEKPPARRYLSMGDMVRDLEDVARRIETGDVRRRLLHVRLDARQRRIATVAGGLVLVAAVGTAILLWRLGVARAASATIAVFTFTSRDPALEWFTEGLRDLLVSDLLKIARLRVRSADRVGGEAGSLREVAKHLGATYVLDGNVLQVGGRVRVTARLDSGRAEETVWSGIYEKDLADVMTVQREITRAVVDNISIEVTPEEKALLENPYQANPEAAASVLKGTFYVNKMSVENLRRGLDQFSKAVELDPGYALAGAWLGHAWQVLGSAEIGVVRPSESARRAAEAARSALAQDPLLGVPHRVLGQVRRDHDWDFAGAREELETAASRDPGDAETKAQQALLDIVEGRFADALAHARAARDSDPLTLWYASVVAFAQACLGEWEETDREIERALEFGPEHAFTLATRGTLLALRGRYAEAAAALGAAISFMPEYNPVVSARRAYALARSGKPDESRRILADLEARSRKGYIPASALAAVHAGLGDLYACFALLARAVEEREPQLIYLMVNPEWIPLRDDPRFGEIMKKVGLKR